MPSARNLCSYVLIRRLQAFLAHPTPTLRNWDSEEIIMTYLQGDAFRSVGSRAPMASASSDTFPRRNRPRYPSCRARHLWHTAIVSRLPQQIALIYDASRPPGASCWQTAPHVRPRERDRVRVAKSIAALLPGG